MGGELEWTVSTFLPEKRQGEQVESLRNGWRVGGHLNCNYPPINHMKIK